MDVILSIYFLHIFISKISYYDIFKKYQKKQKNKLKKWRLKV